MAVEGKGENRQNWMHAADSRVAAVELGPIPRVFPRRSQDQHFDASRDTLLDPILHARPVGCRYPAQHRAPSRSSRRRRHRQVPCGLARGSAGCLEKRGRVGCGIIGKPFRCRPFGPSAGCLPTLHSGSSGSTCGQPIPVNTNTRSAIRGLAAVGLNDANFCHVLYARAVHPSFPVSAWSCW